jgi:DNA topoisomerase-1
MKPRNLVYSGDTQPGYRRRREHGHFVYITPNGARVRAARTLARIRRLAIPPAYTDVWICRDARGHLQASGRDARGRKQYRYHPDWRSARDASKYGRHVEFAQHLPAVRAAVQRDIALPALPSPKVLALVVRLLETTSIRIGNEEYSRQNHSYGLTTLQMRHLELHGSRMRFRFRGKNGKFHDVRLHDARLAAIVRRVQELPGQDLFQFVDDDGAVQAIGSADVNAYIREHTAADFSAKDFRTWTGTLLAAQELAAAGYADDEAETKKRINAAIAHAARSLGNTLAVCRASYVHPGIFDAYRQRRLPPAATRQVTPRRGLSVFERAVLRLLNPKKVRMWKSAGARARR